MPNSCPGSSEAWGSRCTTALLPVPAAFPAAAVTAWNVLIGACDSLPCSSIGRNELYGLSHQNQKVVTSEEARTPASSLMKKPPNKDKPAP